LISPQESDTRHTKRVTVPLGAVTLHTRPTGEDTYWGCPQIECNMHATQHIGAQTPQTTIAVYRRMLADVKVPRRRGGYRCTPHVRLMHASVGSVATVQRPRWPTMRGETAITSRVLGPTQARPMRRRKAVRPHRRLVHLAAQGEWPAAAAGGRNSFAPNSVRRSTRCAERKQADDERCVCPSSHATCCARRCGAAGG
jgi:hypothetical protein